MTTLTLYPSAKVNLFLKVGACAPDGYHPLLTLFERLDLADTLTLKRSSSGIVLTCSDPSVPSDGRNLVVKAAEKFFEALGRPVGAGAKIDLLKKIPVAGGLGGGSSDAASTVLGLNELYGRPLELPQLMALGGTLGADVPFFISGAVLAWGTGRGDQIKPIDPPASAIWHVLVNPGIPMLTREIYAAFDRVCPAGSDLTAQDEDVKLLTRLVQGRDPGLLSGSLVNSLELAIDTHYPAIREVKESLMTAGCFGCLVSGSGSTTYGLVRDQTQARTIQKQLQETHPSWTVIAARTALPDPRIHGVRQSEEIEGLR